jgi:hypothetical protein
LRGKRSDAAARPHDQHRLAAERLQQLHEGEPRTTGSRERRRDFRIEPVRHQYERRILGDGDVLGVRSRRPDRSDQQLAEDFVASGEPRRILTDVLHDALDIGAQDHRERRGRRPPGTGSEHPIHRIHAGGPHLDQDLATFGLRCGQLGNHRLSSISSTTTARM